MKEKIKQKCFIQLTLLMLIIGGLFFVAQPTQAGFFDWFSSTWYKTQSIFIKEQVQESLPASISEPIKETPLPEETILKTPALEIQETSEAIRPVATSEAAASEKVIYRNNPEQEITIKNLRNQITSLQNQIKNLEKQIEDLLSKSPEIKIITKEIPVEKIVVREIIKEVPKEKIIIKEVPVEKVVIKEVIKEVPVEKIVTKEVLVPQTCPACQSCQSCSSNLGSVPSSPPVVGSFSIQEITVPPHQNTWKITANGEPIKITDIVFQFVMQFDPSKNNLNDIDWHINWGEGSGTLNYRTCATATSYDQEFGTNWTLPECIIDPNNSDPFLIFVQYRNKDWWGRDVSGPIPVLKDGDSLYINRSYANRPIKVYGVGQTSGKIIELGN